MDQSSGDSNTDGDNGIKDFMVALHYRCGDYTYLRGGE
jgi:hypothetical protein